MRRPVTMVAVGAALWLSPERPTTAESPTRFVRCNKHSSNNHKSSRSSLAGNQFATMRMLKITLSAVTRTCSKNDLVCIEAVVWRPQQATFFFRRSVDSQLYWPRQIAIAAGIEAWDLMAHVQTHVEESLIAGSEALEIAEGNQQAH